MILTQASVLDEKCNEEFAHFIWCRFLGWCGQGVWCADIERGVEGQAFVYCGVEGGAGAGFEVGLSAHVCNSAICDYCAVGFDV